jgi:hypothetical protein
MIIQNSKPFVYQKLIPVTLTEQVLIHITRVVFRWIPPETKVQTWLKSLAFRSSLKRAYRTFACHYPQWVDVLFDEHFVRHTAAPLLTRYLRQHSTPPSPIELAIAWSDQFATGSPTRKHISQLTPAAIDFLGWLETELQHQPPVFQQG